MSEISIYTDGSCLLETGVGGWGLVWFEDGIKKHACSGGALDTTNNRMELTAVIEACHLLLEHPTSSPATIITDSMYVKNGLTDWIHNWRKLGWRSSTGPIKNVDLWQTAYRLFYVHLKGRHSLRWVKGHNGTLGNEMADNLAERARVCKQEEVHALQIRVLETRIKYLESLMGTPMT